MRPATYLIAAMVVVISAGVSFTYAQGAKPQPTPNAINLDALKEQNPQAIKLNAIITEFNTAAAAKNWQAAESAAVRLVAADPRWEYYSALGAVQLNLAKYAEAAASFEAAVNKAGNWADLKTADAKIRTGVGQALVNQGNALLKLRKSAEAERSYERAAELSPNPGLAWFNLCATNYNAGNMDGAAAACDKAIAAEPSRADAWFIKGSLLLANSKIDANGKTIAPPGTEDALKKYLEFAPNGAHAADVREMLAYLKGSQ